MIFEILKKIKQNLLVFLIFEIFLAIILGGFIFKDNIPKDLLKASILPIIYLMLIPAMMNLNLKEVLTIKKYKLVFSVLLINFVVFPLFAYLIYLITGNFYLFIALMLLSLLPTGSMTMNFVNMLHGNLHTTAVIQILCLTIGAFLVPLVIPIIVSEGVKINSLDLFYKVVIVIFVPLLIGQILRFFIGENYIKQNKEKIKLVGMSGMLLIIFVSTLLKSEFIIEHVSEIVINFILILVYYLISVGIGYTGRSVFGDIKDWIAFLYTVFLKNISIALGLSVVLFPESVIYLVIAYLIQLPLASYIMHRIEKEVLK